MKAGWSTTSITAGPSDAFGRRGARGAACEVRAGAVRTVHRAPCAGCGAGCARCARCAVRAVRGARDAGGFPGARGARSAPEGFEPGLGPVRAARTGALSEFRFPRRTVHLAHRARRARRTTRTVRPLAHGAPRAPGTAPRAWGTVHCAHCTWTHCALGTTRTARLPTSSPWHRRPAPSGADP